MRGVPAWHWRHSVQHPSSVSALRADPPSPTRGEGGAHRRLCFHSCGSSIRNNSLQPLPE
ncbi:MAG: hypothetical protein E5W87_30685 [Mesorhizobium sp.]|nr:MAG: hypothetical protein E5W87_30685 [Mesorhizobium sp.]